MLFWKNGSSRGRQRRTILSGFWILLVLFFAAGCASARKGYHPQNHEGPITNSPQNPTETMGPPEPYGPPVPEKPPTYGPEPTQVKPVVLVFGPGLARGYAYVGVIRALHDAKVPIGAVFGTEMGGLIGSLYVLSPTINQFEWGLLKFKEDAFQEKKSIFSLHSNGPSQGEKFSAQLKQVFENKDLSAARIPLKVAIQRKDTGIPMVLERGRMTSILRVAMASPNLFTPFIWNDGKEVVAASATRPFMVNEAKNLGLGPVIVVDVLNDSDSAVALDEMKIADLVIKPDMTGISYLDFQKRTDAAFRGKSAVQMHLLEICRLVGLPDPGTDKRSNYP